MENMKLTTVETDMAKFDFEALQTEVEKAKAVIATTESVEDIKEQICNIWRKIKPFIGILKHIPFVGKFIVLLEGLMDSFCG